MQDILKRIQQLIDVCSKTVYGSTYEEIKYEINNLILDTVGKGELYSNFLSVANASLLNLDKCRRLVGVLNGLKNTVSLRMNTKKYQVFISSTYQDLFSYRKAVAEDIVFKGHIAAGMEDFTACGEDLETYIKRVIDESDYYVLIIGQRFGTAIPTDSNMSYTMMEYNYAVSKNKRIIPFIYNGTTPLEGNDLDKNKERFEKFVSKIKGCVPQYFKDVNDLLRKMAKALETEMKNNPQKGWIRL